MSSTVSLHLPLLRTTIICIGILLSVIVGLKTGYGQLLIPIGISFAILAAVSLQYAKLVLALAIVLSPSSLTIPLLPSKLILHDIAILLLAVLFIPTVARSRNQSVFNLIHLLSLLLAFLVLFIMVYRGTGLLIFSGDLVGGFRYYHIFSSIGLYFAASFIALPSVWWPRMIAVAVVLSMIPYIYDVLLALSLGPSSVLSSFIRASAQTQALQSGIAIDPGSTTVYRLFSGRNSCVWMALGLLSWRRPRLLFSNQIIVYSPLILLIIVVSASSGFRIAFLSILMIFFFASVLDRAITIPRIVTYFAISIVCFLVLFQTVDLLPISFQRSLSLIPGIDIDATAKLDAQRSILWRLEVWKLAWVEAPAYLWIGKGLTFLLSDYLYGAIDNVAQATINSVYHNGPLSTLIVLGVPGFILLITFTLYTTYHHLQIQWQSWNSPTLQNIHLVFLSWYLTKQVTFWVLYGDIEVSVPKIFLVLSILEAIRLSDKTEMPSTAK